MEALGAFLVSQRCGVRNGLGGKGPEIPFPCPGVCPEPGQGLQVLPWSCSCVQSRSRRCLEVLPAPPESRMLWELFPCAGKIPFPVPIPLCSFPFVSPLETSRALLEHPLPQDYVFFHVFSCPKRLGSPWDPFPLGSGCQSCQAVLETLPRAALSVWGLLGLSPCPRGPAGDPALDVSILARRASPEAEEVLG